MKETKPTIAMIRDISLSITEANHYKDVLTTEEIVKRFPMLLKPLSMLMEN
jgi:hypothetical protein